MTTDTRTRIEPLYKLIATALDARINCDRSNNREWFERWTDHLQTFERELLPSGSGIDNGCSIDLERSNGGKVVIHTGFHHMNEGGMYDGWTDHTVIVRGSLVSAFELTISGSNRNDIKEYLSQVFHDTLSQQIVETFDPSTNETTFRPQLEPAINAVSVCNALVNWWDENEGTNGPHAGSMFDSERTWNDVVHTVTAR